MPTDDDEDSVRVELRSGLRFYLRVETGGEEETRERGNTGLSLELTPSKRVRRFRRDEGL